MYAVQFGKSKFFIIGYNIKLGNVTAAAAVTTKLL